jgi:hypothetical protein
MASEFSGQVDCDFSISSKNEGATNSTLTNYPLPPVKHNAEHYVLHSRPNEAAVIPLVMAAQTRALMGSNFVKSFASFALRSSPTGHFNASPTA